MIDPQYVLESKRSCVTYVDSHACNANPFLHDLQPNDQLYATASVQFPTTDAEQHRVVSVRARRLTLVDDTVLDILELCFGSDSIVSLVATQALEDVSRLFISSDFCQPARALREEPADGE